MKKLAFQKETLRHLQESELSAVAGGQAAAAVAVVHTQGTTCSVPSTSWHSQQTCNSNSCVLAISDRCYSRPTTNC